jgi:large subunit ribosomal protein L29
VTPSELREKKLQELKTLATDLKEELFKIKMQAGTGQLEKTHRLGEVKRDIARVATIIGEKTRKAEV